MDISEDMQTEVDDILERYQRKMLQFLRIFRGEMDNQRRRTPLRIPRSLVRLFIKTFSPKDEPENLRKQKDQHRHNPQTAPSLNHRSRKIQKSV